MFRVILLTFILTITTSFSHYTKFQSVLNSSDESPLANQNISLNYSLQMLNSDDKAEIIKIHFPESIKKYIIDYTYPDYFDVNNEAKGTIIINYPHNVKFNLVAFAEIKYKSSLLYLPLISSLNINYENTYYSETFDLYGEDLKNKLTEIISDAREYTYKEARNHIWSFDAENNIVECVYTGNKTEVTFPPDFAQLDKNGFNTEHTWPRAEGAADEPELSDMFHIYPTDKNANSKRGNYAFGYVTGDIFWEDGGSKLGFNDDFGERFEPRDQHKGNVARSMFYFAIRYYNKFNNFNYLAKQENDLKEWMKFDPVDNREKLRNDSIYKYQENRNPFIDHPAFLERINRISGDGDLPEEFDLVIINDTIKFSFNDVSDNDLMIPLFIYNNGNTTANISNINQLTKNVIGISFNEDILPLVIEPGQVEMINVTANKEFDNKAVYELVDTDDNPDEFVVILDPSTSVNNSFNYINSSISPNPFFDETKIKFQSEFTSDAQLIISDILGNTVNLSSDIIWNDNTASVYFRPEKHNLYGNTFYYNVFINNNKSFEGILVQTK